MATFKEINFILGLDISRFLSASREAQSQYQGNKNRIERDPIEIRANVENIVNGFARLGLAISGIRQTYQLLIGPAQEANKEFLNQEKSLRQLEAAAKLTNVPLEDLTATSQRIQEQFALTTTQANEFVVAANKLAVASGDATRTGEILERLFDLAAGQGLNASEALLRFEQAIKGVDEGTEALFSGKNPIDLYKEYAAQIGVAATKMDDQQKKQAILNAIIRDGTTLQGEYNKFLNEAGGIQARAANQSAELRAQVGELLNSAYIPLLQITTPIVTALNSMDDGTRNASLALIAFIGVTVKVRTSLLAMRAALTSLNIFLGPTGWLILGIGAAAMALEVYAASADEATTANEKLDESAAGVAEKFRQIENSVAKTYSTAPISELIKQQEFYKEQLDISRQTLAGFYRDIEAGKKVSEGQIKDWERAVKDFEARVKGIERVIQDRNKLISETTNVLTEEELAALDKRRAYEFESNRISLAEYIAYLESRQAALRGETETESAEYLRFIDRIAELRQQLREEDALKLLPDTLEIRTQSEDIVNTLSDFYNTLFEIRTGFQEQSFSDLQSEFDTRRQMSDFNLQLIEQTVGRETQLYDDELEKRRQLEAAFQTAKVRLAEQGALATIAIGSQLANVFQGQSETLFEIGKALSVAQVTIDAYQAAARAFKDYPWPFNIVVSAIQFGLAFGQIARIQAVNFKPSGFEKGGMIKETDIVRSIFTPPGETGIIGVQTYETIMNRGATKRFYPILEWMNEVGRGSAPAPQRQSGKMPGFQEGGVITSPAVIQPTVENAVTPEDLERIVDAIRNIRIDIRTELDTIQFFRDNYPRYSKLENRRTVK